MPDPAVAQTRHRLPPAVRALRPRQWLKNVLIFSAPLAAGSLFEPDVLARSALAFVAFCLINSCIYLINDIRDVGEDRQHPRKRERPIASGELSIPAGWMLGLFFGAAGLVLGYLVSPGLGATVSVYVLLQLAYSGFLKHQPILDLAIVAAGFLLRVIAGGAATDIHLSHWLLLVASFGSLFMVSGKRYSEILRLGSDTPTRRAMAGYTDSFLRFVWMLSAGLVVIFYGLWAVGNADRGPLDVGWTVISIAPFALGLLQYARRIDTGNAGAPEDVMIHDRSLLTFGGVWLVLICIAVFA
jgi:decaprenyl-phosphate phosphoribosyltransferase